MTAIAIPDGFEPAWYVYALLPAATAIPTCNIAPDTLPDGLPPDEPIEIVPLGRLAAVAGVVSRAAFDAAHPGRRTADPAWAAGRIATHHAVNAAFAAAGASLPLAFGALFSDLDGLRDWAATHETALLEALTCVTGRTEWALSLCEDTAMHADWLDRHDPALSALVSAAAAATEGTAFLIARRLDKARTNARLRHLDTAAAEIAARLTALAMAGQGFDMLSEPAKAGLPGWTVLSPLIPRVAEPARPPAAFATLDHDLAPAGLSLRVTGPWPPYAFARAALQRAMREGFQSQRCLAQSCVTEAAHA